MVLAALPADWMPHRRDDGELVGWIHPSGAEWMPVDVLGRPASRHPLDWLEAEAALEAVGLHWLADVWILERGDELLRVRMLEVTPPHGGPGRIVVKPDDFSDVSAPAPVQIELPWPLPVELRVPRPGDPDGRTIGA